MTPRAWTFLSRVDARWLFLLVLVLITALMVGPWLDRQPVRPHPPLRLAERDRPEPEPPAARPPAPPLHPEVVPFTSRFLERAVAEGILDAPALETEPDAGEPWWAPPPAPAPPEPEPEPEPVPPGPEPEPGILVYRGVFVRPDGRRLGLVEWADAGHSRFLAEGDTLGPVAVERIDSRTLTLRRGDARHELPRDTPVSVPGGAHE